MARGKLRLYLGAAPGVGKTYAMLNEGWRRKERGTDVVIGWVQEHGRPQTDAQIRDLEIFPAAAPSSTGARPSRRWTSTACWPAGPSWCWSTSWPTPTPPGPSTPSDGRTSRSCSTPASTSSPPSTCSTSSRSTTWSSGSPAWPSTRRSPTRWSGPPTRSSWSTWPPRRCVAGWPTATSTRPSGSTPPSATTSAPGNLTALRELALLWVADRVDEELNDYRERHNIAGPWETKERVVVSLTGSRGSAVLIRRAARMAMRTKAELVGVHVRTDDSLTGAGFAGPGRQPGPARRPGWPLRRGGRRRRGAGPGPGGPGRERHPAGHGGHPPEPADRVRPGLGHQLGHPGRRRLARRPRHRHRGGDGYRTREPDGEDRLRAADGRAAGRHRPAAEVGRYRPSLLSPLSGAPPGGRADHRA